MASNLELHFTWIRGSEITQEILEACACLYSSHYGVWSTDSPFRPDARIRLSSDRLRAFLSAEDSWVALAYHQGILIAYAFAICGDIAPAKKVTWVSQLVVHEDYRNRDVAKRLLNSLWGFSDQYAWGLVTSNPFAVRALEKATRRRCDLAVIEQYANEIYRFGVDRIEYVAGKELLVDRTASILDTEFYVSHSELPIMLKKATENAEWKLGTIGEGQEWFAFTFGTQAETTWTQDELLQILADADRIVRQAYARMRLDHGHKWAGHTDHEIDQIIETLKLTAASRIADFGCGNGRHLLELGRRGYSGVGFDFVAPLIEHARAQVEAQGIHSIEFKEAELIVRDRRYRRDELIQKFADVGIKAISCQYVQAGHWDRPLEALDERAKEILFLGEKR